MRSTFVMSFVIGFALVLAGGYLLPWGEHQRVASKTSVAMNGGRQETFLIYLPADRIVEVAETVSLPLVSQTAVRAPAELAVQPLLAEHFKLRDADGTVVGVGTRHWSVTPAGAASVWALSIPSRGTLVLAADGDVPERLRQALAGVALEPGSIWASEIEIGVATERLGAHVVTGTEEFGNVAGRYTETWRLTGVNERGELQGTVVLDTTVNQSS